MLPPILPPLPVLTPEQSTDELLTQMRLVVRASGYTAVRYPGYKWTAQAIGCPLHGSGATPRAAMLHALQLLKETKSCNNQQ